MSEVPAAQPEDAVRDPRPGSGTTFAGAILVVWSLLGAVAVHSNPQPNVLDRLGFDWIAKTPHSVLLLRITGLGTAAALVIGSVVAGLVCVRRDRARALACVGGPLLCALSVEFVFKPLVGRRFEGVLCYPSGNTADVAALATAWVLAFPARLRPLVAVVGAVSVCAMFTAVVGLRWHLPTDAMAGVVLGIGIVLLVDGLLHLAADARARSGHTRSGRQPVPR